jgi:hypothetical protein
MENSDNPRLGDLVEDEIWVLEDRRHARAGSRRHGPTTSRSRGDTRDHLFEALRDPAPKPIYPEAFIIGRRYY